MAHPVENLRWVGQVNTGVVVYASSCGIRIRLLPCALQAKSGPECMPAANECRRRCPIVRKYFEGESGRREERTNIPSTYTRRLKKGAPDVNVSTFDSGGLSETVFFFCVLADVELVDAFSAIGCSKLIDHLWTETMCPSHGGMRCRIGVV